MSKPYIHAESSVRKFGGKSSDYEYIHSWFDSSKESFPDNRHRGLLHHTFGIFLAEQLFGIDFAGIDKLKVKYNLPDEFESDMIQFLKQNRHDGTCIKNSDGKKVSARDISEQHVSEDFKGRFIPSAQDYLAEIEFKDWMNNGSGVPPSFAKIEQKKIRTIKEITYD